MNECSNPIRKITKEGEDYIRTECSRNNKISGKISKPLPFTYPPVSKEKIWYAKVYRIDNNELVDTNEKWADYLIFLYNHFANLYDIDPNILAAQAYIESHYILWNYAQTSSASGISQFISKTIFGVIIKNRTGRGDPFTIEEKNKITYNFNINPYYNDGDEHKLNSFTYNASAKGKYYRELLHQNIINNPDIMIKAQFRYMKYISTKTNNLASSTLFCYNRGHAFAKNTYSATVKDCENRFGSNYIIEGVNYVDKIYAVLGDKNGDIFPKVQSYKLRGKSFGYDKYIKQYFNKDELYERKFYETEIIYGSDSEPINNDPLKNILYNPFGCDKE